MYVLKLAGATAVFFSALLFIFMMTETWFRKRRCMDGLPDLKETADELRFARAATERFLGVEAVFGCGHVQRIQLLERGTGVILRNVPWAHAHERNCHACWFRTGRDFIDAGEDS